MPGTAHAYGFDASRLQDVDYNDLVAKHIISDLSRKFEGDLSAMLVAYNAGPRRIRSLRTRAAVRGLDPNVWFGNVEAMASQVIGSETVHYVSNISKYYLAYRMIENRRREKEAAAAR